MIKGIIGAVIGDIVGSSREGKPISRQTFNLFVKESSITDDSVLTTAVAEWMLDRKRNDIVKSLIKWAEEYPHAGYGSSFKRFMAQGAPMYPGSTHNGAAMRVSPVGYLATSLDECMELAAESARPSHDSRQAIAAAQATSAAIFMALRGSSKEEIRKFIEETFGYDLHRPYDSVRAEVRHARAMRDTDYEMYHDRLIGAEPAVQDALIAFLAGNDYEDVIRKAIWIGGDADTEAAIAGGIAAAYYGVPEEIIEQALPYIPSDMLDIINKVDGTSWTPSKVIPPKSSRWSIHDVIICGTDMNETEGERAFHLTRPSRFHRHYNFGYYIHIKGNDLESIKNEIWVLRRKCEDYRHVRWHLHDVGIEYGVFTVEQFRELFRWALDLDNILVTPTLLNL